MKAKAVEFFIDFLLILSLMFGIPLLHWKATVENKAKVEFIYGGF